MEIRKIHQKILDAALGICLNEKISLLNIIKIRQAGNKDQETNRKLLSQAKAIEKAIKVIKEDVYNSC